MANIDAATTLKLGGVIEQYIIGTTALGPGLIGLFLVLMFSAFFCWLYSPEDKSAAFTRGLSVFAVLSAVTPYSMIDNSSPGNEPTNAQQIISQSSSLSLISSAYADDASSRLKCKEGVLAPNATLIAEKNVSSCKPYFSGFLGLGSFFNNSIEYCPSKHALKKNERVKLLKSWETGLRGYRYSEVQFQVNDNVCTGWVSDGRRSVKYVVTD